MSDIAKLQIRVDSLEAQTASNRLKTLSGSGAKAEKATAGLTSSFVKLLGPITSVLTVTALLNKTLNAGRELSVYNASLITATGSAEKAAIAFEALQEFAAKTPYTLDQSVEGFQKLVNLGLTPSEEALTSYGNTAAAMGKDLSQMVEAVADATTGEFERLKEFGIKSSSEGDKVSFTFQGVTTNVGKNAAEIEQYLLNLGNVNFAGDMQKRAESLDGILNTLSATWDNLFIEISSGDFSEIVAESARMATEAIQELTDFIASGEMQAYYNAFLAGWQGTFDAIGDSVTLVSQYLSDTFDSWAKDAGETEFSISQAFFAMPANIKAAFQIIGVEINAALQRLDAFDRAFTAALNPFDDYSFDEAWDYYENRVESINATVSRGYAEISNERNKTITGIKNETDAAEELRIAYEKAKQARENSTEDRLAQFKINPQGSTSDSTSDEVDSATSKRLEREKAAREKEFASLVDSLRTEEEAIQASYDKRLAIILANTEEGSEQRAKLTERLNENFATEALGDFAMNDDTYESQMETIQEQYEARRKLILENVQLTEEERTELETELTQARNEKLAELEMERQSMVLQSSSDMFSSLSTISAAYAGEQSALYQTMFAVSKAFAIANSIVKIQQGIAEAAALPFPANIPAMATVAASTASIVSTIEGTQLQGYKEGGYTGNVGTSDVAGVVHGQEFVFDAESTRRIGVGNLEAIRKGQSDNSSSSSAGGTTSENPQTGVNQTNVRIINSVDSSVMEQYMGSKKGEKVIMNVIKNNPSLVKSAVRG